MDQELRQQLQEMFKAGYFLERQRAALRGLNPIDAPPSWIDEELRDALNAIEGPHERKKRTTVLRLAEAKASGLSVKNVFESEDCCSSPIWYGRKKPYEKEGWMDYPDITRAYELAERKAHAFYDHLEEQRMAMRRHILDDTQDRLTEISGAAVEVLLDIMLDDTAASDVRRKAAVDALTHAAPETAPKSQTESKIDLGVTTTGPSMRDIRNRRRQLPDRTVDVDVKVPEGVPALEVVVDEDGPPPPPPGGLKIPAVGLYDEPPTIVSDNGHGEEEDLEDAE